MATGLSITEREPLPATPPGHPSGHPSRPPMRDGLEGAARPMTTGQSTTSPIGAPPAGSAVGELASSVRSPPRTAKVLTT